MSTQATTAGRIEAGHRITIPGLTGDTPMLVEATRPAFETELNLVGITVWTTATRAGRSYTTMAEITVDDDHEVTVHLGE